jgi:hypothetical protein
MKCLTLMQPWATLIAAGAKRVETRSWATAYRGPLAIHASARLPAATRMLFAQEPFASAFREAGILRPEDFPLGKVLAVCRLVDCQRITVESRPEEPEASFGDYTPGRWAWLLEDVEVLRGPVAARGRLGLWEWP